MGREELFTSIPIPGYLDTAFAVISVTDPSSNFISYRTAENRNCQGVLALKFSDLIDNKGLEDDNRFKLINEQQAQLIASFVRAMETVVQMFVINCDAGICRSSAIGAAIAEYLNQDSKWIWHSTLYSPNTTVYNLVAKALGVQTLRSYYEQLQSKD